MGGAEAISVWQLLLGRSRILRTLVAKHHGARRGVGRRAMRFGSCAEAGSRRCCAVPRDKELVDSMTCDSHALAMPAGVTWKAVSYTSIERAKSCACACR